MRDLRTLLQYLDWAFWLGGAVFAALGGFGCYLVAEESVSADKEWIVSAMLALGAIGLVVCVGARIADSVLVNRALSDAYAQFKKSDPNAQPNEGQLAMLAGLPESRMWQARNWLAKQK